jgi:hypothetical protein
VWRGHPIGVRVGGLCPWLAQGEALHGPAAGTGEAAAGQTQHSTQTTVHSSDNSAAEQTTQHQVRQQSNRPENTTAGQKHSSKSDYTAAGLTTQQVSE